MTKQKEGLGACDAEAEVIALESASTLPRPRPRVKPSAARAKHRLIRRRGLLVVRAELFCAAGGRRVLTLAHQAGCAAECGLSCDCEPVITTEKFPS